MIREYMNGDHLFIAQIYHDAIYQLASDDYSQKQLDAWANPPADFDRWKRRCEKKRPFVNEIDGRVVGFIELDSDGHIDCTYVDPSYARRGVMSELMVEIKKVAANRNDPKLFAEVSRTARPFFERHGFEWVRNNQIEIRGVTLNNFIMECNLDAEQVTGADRS